MPGQANKPMSKPAHALDRDTVRNELSADAKQGLSAGDAQSRLQEYGPNELEDGPGVQPFKILLRQIANAMMLVSAPDWLGSRRPTNDNRS